MRTIYKYPLLIADTQLVQMPRGAQPLSVQVQQTGSVLDSPFAAQPMLWAVVDTGQPLEWRKVCVVGTGNEMPAEIGGNDYVGTVQIRGFVWHFFMDRVGDWLNSKE